MPIHKYIKNEFLTCTREVGDPILSQNIDLKYEVPKGQTGQKICKQTPYDVLRSMASLDSGYWASKSNASHMSLAIADTHEHFQTAVSL